MIRVLQCIVGMNRGGLETFTMGLMRNMDRSRVQFDFLVSLDGAYDKEIRQLGGRIYKIPFIAQSGPFKYTADLNRFFIAHPEYRIIHIQMDKFGGLPARVAHRSGLPVRIVHSHNTKNEGGVLYGMVKNHYGRLVARHATHLMACGRDAAEWMFKKAAPLAFIAHNGVDLCQFYPDDRREGSFTLGHVGRFTENKNHSFLIDIFFELIKMEPDARLLLTGDGKLRAEMETKVNRLSLSHAVAFLGVRPDVQSIMSRCDALCMPSLFEGLPVTLVEAQACGIPALVSDNITAECDLTGDVGFMPLSASPAAWAAALLKYKGRARRDNAAVLESAGYSIRHTAATLQEYYLKLNEEAVDNK